MLHVHVDIHYLCWIKWKEEIGFEIPNVSFSFCSLFENTQWLVVLLYTLFFQCNLYLTWKSLEICHLFIEGDPEYASCFPAGDEQPSCRAETCENATPTWESVSSKKKRKEQWLCLVFLAGWCTKIQKSQSQICLVTAAHWSVTKTSWPASTSHQPALTLRCFLKSSELLK